MATPAEEIPIEVHDLTVAYQHRPVLWDIDLRFPQGQLIGIVGPNGAGKSTLIKAIMGLVPLASGHVEVFGQRSRQALRSVAYVPQRESVDWDFPTTALDVVLMGRYGQLPLFGRPRAKDKEIARQSLAKVGMQDYADRQISQLSGGQQQRVFLARALAQQTRVYLMDEPFAGVDASTEKAILNLRTVAFGPVATTFTEENLNATYGGRLHLLSDVTERLRQGEWSARKQAK